MEFINLKFSLISNVLGNFSLKYAKTINFQCKNSKLTRVLRNLIIEMYKTADYQNFSIKNTIIGEDQLTCVVELDYNMIAYSSFDCNIRVIDLTGQKCQNKLLIKGHSRVIFSFFKFRGFLYTSSNDKTIKIWNMKENNKLIHSFQAHSSNIYILINHYDKFIISGSADKSIKLWDLYTFELFYCFEIHLDTVWNVISIETNLVLSVSSDKSIILLDIYSRQVLKKIDNAHNDVILSVGLIHNKYFASGSWDQCLKIWKINDFSNVYSFNLGSSIWCIKELFNDHFGAGLSNGFLIIYDISSFSQVLNLQIHEGNLFSFIQLKDYSIITSSFDKKLKILN